MALSLDGSGAPDEFLRIQNSYAQLKSDFALLQQQARTSQNRVQILEKTLIVHKNLDGAAVGDQLKLSLQKVEAQQRLEECHVEATHEALQEFTTLLTAQERAVQRAAIWEQMEHDAAMSNQTVLRATEVRCSEEYQCATVYKEVHYREAEQLSELELKISEFNQSCEEGLPDVSLPHLSPEQQPRDLAAMRQHAGEVSDIMDQLETEVATLRERNAEMSAMASDNAIIETELRATTERNSDDIKEVEAETLLVEQLEMEAEEVTQKNLELRKALSESRSEIADQDSELSMGCYDQASELKVSVLNAEINILRDEVLRQKEEAAMANEALQLGQQGPQRKESALSGTGASKVSEPYSDDSPITGSCTYKMDSAQDLEVDAVHQDAMERRMVDVENQMRSMRDMLGKIQCQTANSSTEDSGWHQIMGILLSMQQAQTVPAMETETYQQAARRITYEPSLADLPPLGPQVRGRSIQKPEDPIQEAPERAQQAPASKVNSASAEVEPVRIIRSSSRVFTPTPRRARSHSPDPHVIGGVHRSFSAEPVRYNVGPSNALSQAGQGSASVIQPSPLREQYDARSALGASPRRCVVLPQMSYTVLPGPPSHRQAAPQATAPQRAQVNRAAMPPVQVVAAGPFQRGRPPLQVTIGFGGASPQRLG